MVFDASGLKVKVIVQVVLLGAHHAYLACICQLLMIVVLFVCRECKVKCLLLRQVCVISRILERHF